MKNKPFLLAVVLALFFSTAIFAQRRDANYYYYYQQGIEYYNQGNYAKAIECFLEAKAIYEKTLGKNHPYYAGSLDNLYMLYLSKKEYTKALKFKQEQITIMIGLEDKAEALDKSLTQSSAAFRDFKADLVLGWKDVQKSLGPKDVAIEFAAFKLYDKKWTDKTQYAALVLKPGMSAPEWVPLCDEKILSALFEKAAGKDTVQQTAILYDENGAELYKAIWQPLEKALGGATDVYYPPSGLLHKIAFNAIPITGGKRLMDLYDLYLVSSTREVVSIKWKPLS